MFKLIKRLFVLFVLYVGFFGCDRLGVEPFITNWLTKERKERHGGLIAAMKDMIAFGKEVCYEAQ